MPWNMRSSAVFLSHDLVQQLNIVKPAIPRDYTAAGDVGFTGLVWQEGFADYRTQSQSAGAMVELVTSPTSWYRRSLFDQA
jgi:hypothetical protein